MAELPLVVVTGASGFIAKHCVRLLLEKGYTVRGTVRNPARGDDVARAVKRSGVDIARLSCVTANLDTDDGWQAALAGARAVLHVASPFPIEQPRERTGLVATARDGALRVLRAAQKAGVERVVMTSSTVAVMYASGKPSNHVYTEDDWTDPERPELTPYIVSKTLAERAAWDWARATPGAPELVTINPAFVQGPALDPDLSTSLQVLQLMAQGKYPLAPRIAFPICDVRDIAAAHVAAMTAPAAAGRRFIVAAGNLPLIELGRLLAAELPDLKSKAPRAEMPDWLVRGIAKVDRRLASVIPELGTQRVVSSRAVQDVLGLKLIAKEESVRAAARSLRALKVI